MKYIKIFLFLLFILFVQVCTFAKGLDTGKYTVLETTFDYAPIRENANSNAKRYSHLKSGITLFSDEQNLDFFKLDLGLNKPFWIEKNMSRFKALYLKKEAPIFLKLNFMKIEKNIL